MKNQFQMESLAEEEDEENQRNKDYDDDQKQQDGESPLFSSRNNAMSLLHQSVKFNTEIQTSKTKQSFKLGDESMQSLM